MKKKTLVVGLLSGVLTAALLFPKTSSAFWPFDGWLGKGEVKGEQTEMRKPNSIKEFFTGRADQPTPTVTPIDEQEKLESNLTDEKLTRAVRGKLISEANRKAMLAKLAVIKARREELKKLQEEFVAWMKANKVDPSSIEKLDKTETSGQSGKVTPAVRKLEPKTQRNMR